MRGYCPSTGITFSSIHSLSLRILESMFLILRMWRMMPPHRHRDRHRDRAIGRDKDRDQMLHDGLVVILVPAVAEYELMLDSRGVRVDPLGEYA